jgi:hypothetical protein
MIEWWLRRPGFRLNRPVECVARSGWDALVYSMLGRDTLPSFGGGIGRCLEELTERTESLSIGGGGIEKSGERGTY